MSTWRRLTVGISMNKDWRRMAVTTLASAALGVAPLPAGATEGGRTEFPIGVDTALPALMPEPGGTILLSYTQLYVAHRLNDGNGHKAVPSFGVDVEAEAPKLVHTWATVHGFEFGSGLVQPIVNTDLVVLPGLVTGHDFSFGDTNLIPLMVHTDVGSGLHLTIATNIWLPDGHYDVRNPASQGLHRTTIGQQFITTWLPTPRWNLSTSTIVEFGSSNSKTHYYSGSYVNTDFHVGYRLFEALPKLELGLQGYYMVQYENDKQYGFVLGSDGRKGRAAGFGPQIVYDAWKHGGIVLKYQHEVGVENRPEGDRTWLQLAILL